MGKEDGGLNPMVMDSVHKECHQLNNSIFSEEAIPWLSEHLEDSFGKNHCSHFFGKPPNMNVQLQHSHKETEDLHSITGIPCSGIVHSVGVLGSAGNAACRLVDGVQRQNAAMTLGAGRASGFVVQPRAEAFNEATAIMKDSMADSRDDALSTNIFEGLEKLACTSDLLSECLNEYNCCFVGSPQASQSQDVVSSFNTFSHLYTKGTSSHTISKESSDLHVISIDSGTENVEQGRQHCRRVVRDDFVVIHATFTESNATDEIQGKKVDSQNQEETATQCVNSLEDLPLVSSYLPTNSTEDMQWNRIPFDNHFKSSVSGNVATVIEKEIGDRTISSLPGCSSEKSGKETDTSFKRKISLGDESIYECKGHEETEANTMGHPLGRSSASKRSRAAQLHNQSERKRRDKINEKMRALQELIPNSNKTDKASMLDEAIKYLKMLQSQLQVCTLLSLPELCGQSNDVMDLPPSNLQVCSFFLLEI
eukprot:c13025_g1_i1 orf=388-1827(+)